MDLLKRILSTITTSSNYHIEKQGGGGEIRTYSAIKHQIYSLARLSNSGAPPCGLHFENLALNRFARLDNLEPLEGLEPPTS